MSRRRCGRGRAQSRYSCVGRDLAASKEAQRDAEGATWGFGEDAEEEEEDMPTFTGGVRP